MRIITISRQIQTNLMVAQKHVIEGIEKIGMDCVAPVVGYHYGAGNHSE